MINRCVMGKRAEAIANGDKSYRSGKDCIRGHKDPLRTTQNSTCSQCNKINAAEYRAARRNGPAITPRRAAMNAGEETYRTGKPCKHGHVNPLRTTARAQCLPCIKGGTYTYEKKKPDIVISKDETFKQMAQRIYDRNQTW